jgi:hypothetical protein
LPRPARTHRTALVSVCPAEMIDILVTGETAPSAALDQFRDAHAEFG